MIIETEFYVLKVYHNLLYLKAFSSWDEKILKQVMVDMERFSRLFEGKKWAVLNDSKDWGLHTSAAESFARKILKETPLPGQAHNAVIVGESSIKGWQTNNIFKDVTQFETRVFISEQDAVDWLTSLGYTMMPLADHG